MTKLSHVDAEGRASMVDVSDKAATERVASAEAVIRMSAEAFRLVTAGEIKKGDVLATARIAGIMAAKKTSDLIPLCHPLALTHAGVEFTALPEEHAFRILASAKTTGQTGVEMEALTAEAPEDAPPAPAKSSARGKAAPRVLIHEAAAPRPPAANASSERETLRQFMIDRRLRATEWAKSAAVPVNELYGFLSGRSRTISDASAAKLAKAARASVSEMFGRKGGR
jgi:cyclic pyranopterin phosphate synthase